MCFADADHPHGKGEPPLGPFAETRKCANSSAKPLPYSSDEEWRQVKLSRQTITFSRPYSRLQSTRSPLLIIMVFSRVCLPRFNGSPKLTEQFRHCVELTRHRDHDETIISATMPDCAPDPLYRWRRSTKSHTGFGYGPRILAWASD